MMNFVNQSVLISNKLSMFLSNKQVNMPEKQKRTPSQHGEGFSFLISTTQVSYDVFYRVIDLWSRSRVKFQENKDQENRNVSESRVVLVHHQFLKGQNRFHT